MQKEKKVKKEQRKNSRTEELLQNKVELGRREKNSRRGQQM